MCVVSMLYFVAQVVQIQLCLRDLNGISPIHTSVLISYLSRLSYCIRVHLMLLYVCLIVGSTFAGLSFCKTLSF